MSLRSSVAEVRFLLLLGDLTQSSSVNHIDERQRLKGSYASRRRNIHFRLKGFSVFESLDRDDFLLCLLRFDSM